MNNLNGKTAEKLMQKTQSTLLFSFICTLLQVVRCDGMKYCFIILVCLFLTQVFYNVKLLISDSS